MIAVLVGLLVPAVQQARESARRTQCKNNLRQLGLAIHGYESVQGRLPPTAVIVGRPNNVLETSYLGGFGRILPYIEQGNVFNQININLDYGDLSNLPAVARVIPLFLCPSEPNSEPGLNVSFGLIGGNNYGFCMGDWYVWLGVNVVVLKGVSIGRGAIVEHNPLYESGPGSIRTPLQFLEGMITPNGLHFERSHNGIPDIDPDQHRLLIHGSYRCPRWLARLLVYLGVQVGLAGPLSLLRQHELRDYAQRALELEADILMKATRVDGVYSDDPEKNPHAMLYRELTYQQVREQNLRVMDATAISLCRENNMPILVFDLTQHGNIVKVLRGESIGTLVRG